MPDRRGLAVLSDKSLYHSLWAGEKLALEVAVSDIERLRKVNFTVKVLQNGVLLKREEVLLDSDHKITVKIK